MRKSQYKLIFKREIIYLYNIVIISRKNPFEVTASVVSTHRKKIAEGKNHVFINW